MLFPSPTKMLEKGGCALSFAAVHPAAPANKAASSSPSTDVTAYLPAVGAGASREAAKPTNHQCIARLPLFASRVQFNLPPPAAQSAAGHWRGKGGGRAGVSRHYTLGDEDSCPPLSPPCTKQHRPPAASVNDAEGRSGRRKREAAPLIQSLQEAAAPPGNGGCHPAWPPSPSTS